MRVIYHVFAERIKTFLCFYLLVIGCGVCRAKFLEPQVAQSSPRTRMGSYPSSTIGTNFLNLEDLGPHSYTGSWVEKNGILYTCKGGHIDIAHLRKTADWTAYITAKTFDELKDNQAEFSFKLMEPSLYFVEISYPENWQDLPQKQREDIAFDISIRLGQCFIYTATTWHEILTWFGYKCTGILYSEFSSAFTWEDTFSNLLGAHIAGVALRDTEHEYDEAVTLALEKELEKLGIQPANIARDAAKKVRGDWFSGDWLFFINMKKRHFDIGLDDGYVTAAIVPSVAGCEGAEPASYPAPTLDFLSEYGFSVKFEIEPRELERRKILRIIYPDKKQRKQRIEPAIHFASIMAFIKAEAIKKYGHDVDLCDTNPQKLIVEPLEDIISGPDSIIDQTLLTSRRMAFETLIGGDLNGDGKIDFEDLAVIASDWLEPPVSYADLWVRNLAP